MSKMSFDIDGLNDAAGRYDAASAEANNAGAVLAGLSFAPSALGGTDAAQSLGSALQGFTAQHASVAASNTQALGAFAARLRAVSGIGTSSIEESTAASQQAAGYWG